MRITKAHNLGFTEGFILKGKPLKQTVLRHVEALKRRRVQLFLCVASLSLNKISHLLYYSH